MKGQICWPQSTHKYHVVSVEKQTFSIVGNVSSSDENKTYTCIPFDDPTLCPILASFRTNLFLMMEAALPSKITCVWMKMRLWKMSNIRHFNNMYHSHKLQDLAHVFPVYRQQTQIQTTANKNTETRYLLCHLCHKMYLLCHLCHKQEIIMEVICIVLSPSRINTIQDFASCSLNSVLQPWKGFWVTIYICKFMVEVS